MSTTLDTTGTAPETTGRPHWIDDWEPEDPAFWAAGGADGACRNLIFSILSEHIGFSIWTMWSVLVLFLGPKYGFQPEDKFLLTIVPALVGSVLRLPYTFAVATFGGRNWTVFSALLLVLPTVATLLVLEPGVSLNTLLLVSALAGVGGGNFASSMSNINAPYPQHLKGRALGLNAGGGNLGVAAVQLAGLLVLATAGKTHPRDLIAAYLTFIGPLVGSIIRPFGGLLADRFGGARVTFVNFVAMAATAATVLSASLQKSLPLFLIGFCALFVFSGIGNGSTYKMIPAIFRAKSQLLVDAGAEPAVSDRDARRLSGALIGIAGAIGAFGGVLVNVAFRQSFLDTKRGNAAYVAFLAFYAVCFVLTWVVYLRLSARRLAGV